MASIGAGPRSGTGGHCPLSMSQRDSVHGLNLMLDVPRRCRSASEPSSLRAPALGNLPVRVLRGCSAQADSWSQDHSCEDGNPSPLEFILGDRLTGHFFLYYELEGFQQNTSDSPARVRRADARRTRGLARSCRPLMRSTSSSGCGPRRRPQCGNSGPGSPQARPGRNSACRSVATTQSSGSRGRVGS
jgi:hypothetical protein